MPKKSPPKPDEKPQFERFIETAKEIGADETDASLANNVRRISPHVENIKKSPIKSRKP